MKKAEDVYGALFQNREVEENRKGDIKGDISQMQENDYSHLPLFVEHYVNGGYVHKRYVWKDGKDNAYKTDERIKVFTPFDPDDEAQVVVCDLWNKYRDAEPLQKAFLWYMLNVDRDIKIATEEQESSRYNIKEHIKRRWAEVSGHVCPGCGGTIYRNVDISRRVYMNTGSTGEGDARLQIAGYAQPFGSYGEFRCVNCLSSFWYCEDCREFHTFYQERCSMPSVQYEHAQKHAHDSDDFNCCAVFDPSFDPWWVTDSEYEKDMMLRALRNELGEHGDQQVFKYEHSQLNKWLLEAERVWQRKLGLRTLDIHNYKESKMRDHPQTNLEKKLFTYEINRWRLERGEFATGTKTFLSIRPLIIGRTEVSEEESTDDLTIRKTVIDRVERGRVFCDGYKTRQEIMPDIAALVPISAIENGEQEELDALECPVAQAHLGGEC